MQCVNLMKQVLLYFQQHGDEKGLRRCPYCSEGFLKRWMLEQHMLEHTTSIPKESVKNESQENSKKSKMRLNYSGVLLISFVS